VAGALIRVWFVDRHKQRQSPPTLIAAAVLLAIVIWAGMPATQKSTTESASDFARVRVVLTQRCAGCHAAHPTQPGIASAPKGVIFDSEARIKAQAALILQQTVTIRVMPPGNLTQMTEDERTLIARWTASVHSPSR